MLFLLLNLTQVPSGSPQWHKTTSKHHLGVAQILQRPSPPVLLSLLPTIPASQVPLGIPQRTHSVGSTRHFTSYDLLNCLNLSHSKTCCNSVYSARRVESRQITSEHHHFILIFHWLITGKKEKVACIANIFPECSSSPPPAETHNSIQATTRQSPIKLQRHAIRVEMRICNFPS